MHVHFFATRITLAGGIRDGSNFFIPYLVLRLIMAFNVCTPMHSSLKVCGASERDRMEILHNRLPTLVGCDLNKRKSNLRHHANELVPRPGNTETFLEKSKPSSLRSPETDVSWRTISGKKRRKRHNFWLAVGFCRNVITNL